METRNGSSQSDTSDEHFADKRRIGTVLNQKWLLVRLIGVGGMGAVYEAHDHTGAVAALKILHPALANSPRQRNRFLREARAANAIRHSGVVRMFEASLTETGEAFLAMELLNGGSLAEVLRRRGGRLPLPEVLAIADQLLDTLNAAHESGVLHRDIKPDNLLLLPSGKLKVLDFGIARLTEDELRSAPGTEAGTTLGTPAFMPHEQARGRWEDVDARSDIWAVGATLFKLLSGEHVHEAPTKNEQLGMAMTQPARAIARLLPDLPKPFSEVLDRALYFEQNERWQSASDMRRALHVAESRLHGEASCFARSLRDDVPEQPRSRDAQTLSIASDNRISSRLRVQPPSSRRRSKTLGVLCMMSLVSLAVVAAVQQPGGIQSARIAGSLRAVSHSIDTDVALLGPQPRASIDAPDLSTERSAANTSSSTRPLLCRPIQDRAARTISALDGHRASPNPLDRRR